MGGRTHDYHCRNCHTWVDGFYVEDGGTCGCGRWDGFYDLDLEGCPGGCPVLDDCDVFFVVPPGDIRVVCQQRAGHTSDHVGVVKWPVWRQETPK